MAFITFIKQIIPTINPARKIIPNIIHKIIIVLLTLSFLDFVELSDCVPPDIFGSEVEDTFEGGGIWEDGFVVGMGFSWDDDGFSDDDDEVLNWIVFVNPFWYI